MRRPAANTAGHSQNGVCHTVGVVLARARASQHPVGYQQQRATVLTIEDVTRPEDAEAGKHPPETERIFGVNAVPNSYQPYRNSYSAIWPL